MVTCGPAALDLTADGHNSTMYPGFATQFTRQLAGVDLDDFVVAMRAG